jgi:hypothetical protein
MIERILLLALIAAFFMILLEKWKVFEWIQLNAGWHCEFCFAFWLCLVGTAIFYYTTETDIIEVVVKPMASAVVSLGIIRWLRR